VRRYRRTAPPGTAPPVFFVAFFAVFSIGRPFYWLLSIS